MKFTHHLLAIAVASALIGCTPLKVRAPSDDMPMSESSARDAASITWDTPAVTREGTPMMVLATPTLPPESILKRQIKLQLDSGATVRDVVTVLANLGYSVIIADKEAAEKEILAPRFYGTLGGLLASLQRAADVWTVWENGALVVTSRERVAFTLPQERKLANRIATGLQDLGICVNASGGDGGMSAVSVDSVGNSESESISSSSSSSSNSSPAPAKCGGAESGAGGSGTGSAAAWEAGMISMSVSPSEYRRVTSYLERITQNAAVVNLQVAMVSVSTTQEVSRGIDWSKLQLAVNGQHQNLLQTLTPSSSSDGTNPSTGSIGNPNTGTGLTMPNDDEQLPDLGKGLVINAGSMRGVLSNGAFSMIGFLDFLDTYGQTKTLQNVMLRTVTGSEVELKSVTEIPYVSGVGIGSIGNTNNTTNNNSTLGQANTDTANDGITLKMLPSYDAASHSVTIDMSLAIEAVLAFNELSAGNQLGKLTQPTTAKRTFNDVIRVRPGQTVVVGGISYDQVQRDSKVPLYLPGATGHKGLQVKRESMFIVVRPTVTVLGALSTTAELDGREVDKPVIQTSSETTPGAAE
jgi:type II secretory pathway component GspD/PulD (secretin)